MRVTSSVGLWDARWWPLRDLDERTYGKPKEPPDARWGAVNGKWWLPSGVTTLEDQPNGAREAEKNLSSLEGGVGGLLGYLV
jgi:hypothetical protein